MSIMWVTESGLYVFCWFIYFLEKCINKAIIKEGYSDTFFTCSRALNFNTSKKQIVIILEQKKSQTDSYLVQLDILK